MQFRNGDATDLPMHCVQKIREVVGPFKDIPAPDMNTDSRHMAWFFDEYSKFEGFSPGTLAGRSSTLQVCHRL